MNTAKGESPKSLLQGDTSSPCRARELRLWSIKGFEASSVTLI